MHERILAEGTADLSEQELVAALLGGNEPDLLALRILRGGLASLRRARPVELLETQGLRRRQASRLLAALELGRRAVIARGPERPRLLRAEDSARVLWPRLAHLSHEEFWVILLSARLDEIATVRIAAGGLTQCSVLPRDAFVPAIVRGAASVVFAHNHPSGDPSPSAEDHRLAMHLDEVGRALGIGVADHLVLAEGGVHSARTGHCSPPWASGSADPLPIVRAADGS